MTYDDRERIFSKEYLSIKDFEELFGVDYQTAARLIRQIKFKNDRLGILGKVHIEDYFEYFKITDRVRYINKLSEDDDNE